MKYRCPKCGKIFEEMTQDGMCDRADCLGEELVEYAEGSEAGIQIHGEEREPAWATPPVSVGVIEGLCLLVCDISFSMNDPAFADSELSKLRMVTRAVHRAVVELYRISMPAEAYVGIIAFGARAALVPDRSGRPFLLSVSEIQREFGSDGLNPYLFEQFNADAPRVDRQHTDFTGALDLSKKIYDGAIAGDLTAFGVSGEVKILKHMDIYDSFKNEQISVPNVRALLYSDGEYNPKFAGAPLVNAFESVYPSPLMTAFIGNEAASAGAHEGADQMKALANMCVMHQKRGYFLINNAEKYTVLKNLFSMATRRSGFCPSCLAKQIKEFKQEESRPWMSTEEGETE